MKKFFSIFVIMFVFLCSCYSNYDIYIDDADKTPYSEDVSGTKYIASIYGSTYHLENCFIVKNMNEENIRVFYDKRFFTDREMSPCKRCNP